VHKLEWRKLPTGFQIDYRRNPDSPLARAVGSACLQCAINLADTWRSIKLRGRHAGDPTYFNYEEEDRCHTIIPAPTLGSLM
jgi:hypothetical protein